MRQQRHQRQNIQAAASWRLSEIKAFAFSVTSPKTQTSSPKPFPAAGAPGLTAQRQHPLPLPTTSTPLVNLIFVSLAKSWFAQLRLAYQTVAVLGSCRRLPYTRQQGNARSVTGCTNGAYGPMAFAAGLATTP